MPAGQGDTDWKEALKACREKRTPYGFVEQERWEKDPFLCLKEAFDWLNENLTDLQKEEK